MKEPKDTPNQDNRYLWLIFMDLAADLHECLDACPWPSQEAYDNAVVLAKQIDDYVSKLEGESGR